jgi:hypothetical protein
MNRFGNARTGLQTIFLTDTIQFRYSCLIEYTDEDNATRN